MLWNLNISGSSPVSSSVVAFYSPWSRILSSDIFLSHMRPQELPRPDRLVSSGSLYCEKTPLALPSQLVFRCCPAALRLMGQTMKREDLLFKHAISLQAGKPRRVTGDASIGKLDSSGELHEQGTEEDSNYCWFIQSESYLCVWCLFTIWVFKRLVMVGMVSCWKQALCMSMNFTYLRETSALWKNIFVQIFDLKISIQSRLIDCFADKWGDGGVGIKK